ncbi:MAG: FAD-binding protein [Eubacteriales bacterium]|nr:FAD-binding protein [Eubacteriales bacterium]
MIPTYEIAVVGAGPAGATFARLMASTCSIAVLDGKQDGDSGFHKPCGGLLSTDAQKALSHFDLCLPKDVLVDPQIFSVKTLDLKNGLIRHYQRFYVNLDRHRFDRWLQSLIPASVRQICGRFLSARRDNGGFLITYRTSGGQEQQLWAHFLIGADGGNSAVRRAFFPGHTLRSYVAIQQWFPETHSAPFYSCIFDPETSDCCSWSISKDRHFIFGGAFPAQDCRARFERQKEKLAAFGFHFGQPEKTEACVVLRPRRLGEVCLGGEGVFLLGEAAGFISPSSLEGISFAIQSGEMLSDAFHLSAKDPTRAYRRKTRPLRAKLVGKLCKTPFLYRSALRALIMRSGIRSIDVREN